MQFTGKAEPLTLSGLRDAATMLGVDAATILAIIEVETSGCGFLPDRRPAMLFERHIFSRETHGQFDADCPEISYPQPGAYGLGGTHQYSRLHSAMQLDECAALRSASWGIGQIMGWNAGATGYASVVGMIADFCDSEDAQLMAVAFFCKRRKLDGYLRNHDWGWFAHGYNGADYQRNQYDQRLSAAYSRHNQPRSMDLAIRAIQVRLMFAGLYVGEIDGIDGPKTQFALSRAAELQMEA